MELCGVNGDLCVNELRSASAAVGYFCLFTGADRLVLLVRELVY